MSNSSYLRTMATGVIITNEEMLVKAAVDNPVRRFKWLTTEDVIKIYEVLADTVKVAPWIIHEQLISDALYQPIKDIIFYDANKGIFTRICEFAYSIGHAVGTCSVPLMISLFITLCEGNNINTPEVTEDLIDIFTKAYHKTITPNAFKSLLTDRIASHRANLQKDVKDV